MLQTWCGREENKAKAQQALLEESTSQRERYTRGIEEARRVKGEYVCSKLSVLIEVTDNV